MIDAINQYSGFLGLHEYHYTNGPRDPAIAIVGGKEKKFGGWGWWCGRFKVCPWDVPIIITEAGIDAHVMNMDYYGWHGLPEPRVPTYFGQLVDYEMQCILDGRVVAITPFTHDFYDNKWATYDTRGKALQELWVAHARDMESGNYILPAIWPLPKWSSEPWSPGDLPPVSEPPIPKPEPPMTVKVIMLDKKIHSLDWLAENYGVTVDDSLTTEAGYNFRIVEIYENMDDYYTVLVLDEDNRPLEGWAVGRHWPDAPNTWSNGVAPDNVIYPPEAKTSAVFGRTDSQGFVTWVTGPGDVCGPHEGANLFWCPSHQFGGEVLRGNGIFGGKTWLPVFKLIEGQLDPVPEPEPEPDPIPEIWGNKYIDPWKELVFKYKGSIDSRIIGTIIMIESAGKADAVSSAGAIGLMQVMPKEEGFSGRPTKAELLDPDTNVLWGCKILRNNLVVYNNNLSRALAAYYGGSKCGNNLNDPNSIFYLNRFCESWVKTWSTECPSTHTEPEILELINAAIRNLEDAKSKLAG